MTKDREHPDKLQKKQKIIEDHVHMLVHLEEESYSHNALKQAIKKGGGKANRGTDESIMLQCLLSIADNSDEPEARRKIAQSLKADLEDTIQRDARNSALESCLQKGHSVFINSIKDFKTNGFFCSKCTTRSTHFQSASSRARKAPAVKRAETREGQGQGPAGEGANPEGGSDAGVRCNVSNVSNGGGTSTAHTANGAEPGGQPSEQPQNAGSRNAKPHLSSTDHSNHGNIPKNPPYPPANPSPNHSSGKEACRAAPDKSKETLRLPHAKVTHTSANKEIPKGPRQILGELATNPQSAQYHSAALFTKGDPSPSGRPVEHVRSRKDVHNEWRQRSASQSQHQKEEFGGFGERENCFNAFEDKGAWQGDEGRWLQREMWGPQFPRDGGPVPRWFGPGNGRGDWAPGDAGVGFGAPSEPWMTSSNSWHPRAVTSYQPRPFGWGAWSEGPPASNLPRRHVYEAPGDHVYRTMDAPAGPQWNNGPVENESGINVGRGLKRGRADVDADVEPRAKRGACYQPFVAPYYSEPFRPPVPYQSLPHPALLHNGPFRYTDRPATWLDNRWMGGPNHWQSGPPSGSLVGARHGQYENGCPRVRYVREPIAGPGISTGDEARLEQREIYPEGSGARSQEYGLGPGVSHGLAQGGYGGYGDEWQF